MLTNEGLIKEISKKLGQAAKNVITKTLETHGEDFFGEPKTLQGRETEITPSISSEITGHLLDEVEKLLDNKKIQGVRFHVNTYKQSEENITGADLLGILSIDLNGNKIQKFFLAQAKVGTRRQNGNAYCINQDILRQAKDMLNHSPASFFFIYTKEGLEVVSALMIQLLNKNSINTKEIISKDFSEFYKDFFDCFIGDNRIELAPYLINPTELTADLGPRPKNILYINLTKEEN